MSLSIPILQRPFFLTLAQRTPKFTHQVRHPLTERGKRQDFVVSYAARIIAWASANRAKGMTL
jgi:hypothetical protein